MLKTIIQLLRDAGNFKNINQNIRVKDGLIFLEWCEGVYGMSFIWLLKTRVII